MLIAALYDIHANLPALEAVLEEIDSLGVEQIVMGGDVVPGPMPRETLHRLQLIKLPVHYIRGNGEVAILDEIAGRKPAVPEEYRPSMAWNGAQLAEDSAARMATWPLSVQLGDVLFCHATPRNENEIFTSRTPEAALVSAFTGIDAAVVVCGHTHMQFDRRVGTVRVVNAGSVGMPFGRKGAEWLLITGGDAIEFRHTDYDLSAAARRVRASGYPKAEEFAEKNILSVPSEETILELFTRVGIKL